MSPTAWKKVCEDVLIVSKKTRTASRSLRQYFGNTKSNQLRQKKQRRLQQLQFQSFTSERTNQWQLEILLFVQSLPTRSQLRWPNLFISAIEYIHACLEIKIPISTNFEPEDWS